MIVIPAVISAVLVFLITMNINHCPRDWIDVIANILVMIIGALAVMATWLVYQKCITALLMVAIS